MPIASYTFQWNEDGLSFWYRILPMEYDPDLRRLIVFECQPWHLHNAIMTRFSPAFSVPGSEPKMHRYGVPVATAPAELLRSALIHYASVSNV